MPQLKKGKGQVPELYDVEKDPCETTNIASQYPEVVERMRKQLLLWQAGVEQSLTGADYKRQFK